MVIAFAFFAGRPGLLRTQQIDGMPASPDALSTILYEMVDDMDDADDTDHDVWWAAVHKIAAGTSAVSIHVEQGVHLVVGVAK